MMPAPSHSLRLHRHLWLLVLASTASPVAAQLQVPFSHGFAYSQSNAVSSFSRQSVRSEASLLRQVLQLNVSPLDPANPGDLRSRYKVNDPRNAFAVTSTSNSQGATDLENSSGTSFQSGLTFSVFSN